ncbi:Acetate--CoA ligase (ADP-forming) I [Desulfovibrionales bacterium]
MDYYSQLKIMFEPDTIAIIGASTNPGKIGNIILQNLIDSGYKGKIYPVNPKAEIICGLPVVNEISELPKPLDLAIISIPPATVILAVQQLAALPTRAAIVITAGFKEIGCEGYFLEHELVRLAVQSGMVLLGPNCLGMINTDNNINVSFANGYPQPGNIAFFSQSGALCVAILDWALGNNIGFSKFVSLGNKAIIDESAMLAYLANDVKTRVVLGYIEDVENGQRFISTARKITMIKPVIMIKSGTTDAGAKAASSHTGAIAGADQAYTAAFRQSGIIRVDGIETLFNLAQCFSTQPLSAGPNLAIVTNSGGPGILATDATIKSGLLMATLAQKTIKQLKTFLPAYASIYNPIDIIGDATAERYAKTLDIVIDDEFVHAILILLSPSASVEIEATAQAIIEVAKRSSKPIFSCFMGEQVVGPGKRMLQDAGIPCYSFPEPAIQGIQAMFQYSEYKKRPTRVEICYQRDRGLAEKVIAKARAADENEIVEFQAQDLLRAYGLPLPATILARTSDEATLAAEKIGYPVVLKIASPQISHKSDMGGVKVNIKNNSEVHSAFVDITSRAQRLRKDAFISGCLVQAMAPKDAKECIISFKRDPQFGPLVLFGLGGIYVEVLKDISFRLAPLSLFDAQEMIREIKSFPILSGVRGEQPVNFKALEDMILIISQLALDLPEILEAEFNPVLVNAKHAVVADCRIILAPA